LCLYIEDDKRPAIGWPKILVKLQKKTSEASVFMKTRGFNWQLWLGFALCVFAFLSYPFIFAQWPATRDFPWANIPLFIIAAVLLFIGLRRAFARERGVLSKIAGAGVGILSVLVLTGFIMVAFVSSTWMPSAAGAPQVGAKAPDLMLKDTTGRQVSLSELRTAPIQTASGPVTPRGVLLIFYRGYW
jgi:hypothetical protein